MHYSDDTVSDISNGARAPGVRPGSLRGSYNRCDPASKKRILECAEAHGDFKAVAMANSEWRKDSNCPSMGENG